MLPLAFLECVIQTFPLNVLAAVTVLDSIQVPLVGILPWVGLLEVLQMVLLERV